MSFEQLPKKELLIFPDGLTQKDIELIKAQCEHQRAISKEQIEGFAIAYQKTKKLAGQEKIKDLKPQEWLDLILEWSALIEQKAGGKFRLSDVRIKGSVRQPLSGKLVFRAITLFVEKYAEFIKQPPTREEQKRYGSLVPTPEGLYKEFEEIHPFLDGNGRVGDLLWKIAVARETGKWPETLPPEVFGLERFK